MNTTAPCPLPCIFITGAATGIGRATAQLFVQQGWFVGLADVDEAGVQALAQQWGPERAMALRLDVTQADDWAAGLARFHGHTGRLDVLLNNAGILCSGPFEQTDLARHHAVIDVNLKGLINGCHVAKPYLSRTPGARLINLSSSAATYGQPSLATYAASKFAVRGLTEGLNLEWEADGIRVMDVMPLFVQTGMVQGMNARSIDRMGVKLTPDDVAHTIWRATQHQGSWGKVHWPVGFMATCALRLTSLLPERWGRWMAKHLTT